MNIIVGASGQVGSIIVEELARKDVPVRAIVRKTTSTFSKTVEVRYADLFQSEELVKAFEGGTTVFLITPEDPGSYNIINDTAHLIANYKHAIQANGIQRIVGLSCIGAQVEAETGNVLMSRMLERGFDDLDIDKTFVRPSYYYSNWLAYMEPIEKFNSLPTFFPEDLKIEMNSPIDIARFSASIIAYDNSSQDRKIVELAGPESYSSADVAETFSSLLGKQINLQPIPKEDWQQTLHSAGFTENTSANLASMTQAVIDNILVPEKPAQVHRLPTSLYQYLKDSLATK